MTQDEAGGDHGMEMRDNLEPAAEPEAGAEVSHDITTWSGLAVQVSKNDSSYINATDPLVSLKRPRSRKKNFGSKFMEP